MFNIKYYILRLNTKVNSRVATWSGNQEKSGKTKKNDKSQVKMGVFEKSQEKSRKSLKKQILSVKFTNSLYSNSKKLIKNSLCQTKITKFS